ncbi:hypothetical protein NEOLEDRAFT_1171554 [Neolentinus lepideus HHB14362 ss-1]|uniref:Micro-fibrillar-associated protein 1 C-terminal domain-containing protein n=1 Tax=Neolentinus lepideus HHB14362 ss-1 TaxID=1314782 RepID=A0A165Q9Q4_9AGAM|nr:hypothetical protein NEOLEDRAFT_1171554 [Neolentinus lepideus HHB14362 ss-1]
MSTILATNVPRKTAPRPAKPVGRYWKGKAPKGAGEPPSDSDEEQDEEQVEREGEGDERIDEMSGGEDGVSVVVRKGATRAINVALRDVNISKDGKVIVAGREEVGRTAMEDSEEEESEEEEDEKKPSEESSEEETSSEEESEEEKPKVQFRPVFIPKRARVTVAEREALAEDTEEALARKEREAEERRKQSHDMVADSIKRELAEKEKEDTIPDIDDTDGLDPEGEFEAWRLRELERIKREKEEEMALELEREEIERRRALPEEVRMKEDLERAKKLREEKPKGSQKFLQKYWHKGAFHQDQEILKRHDYTESTASHVDVALLPKVMQVRDFGKRSRTKYTHLVDQDTTAGNGGFGGAGPAKRGGEGAQAGCFNCGGPHLKKDCPHKSEFEQRGQGPHGPTGANAAPTGPRRDGGGKSWRDDRPPPSRERNRRDREDWDRRRADDRDRRRSRSRSPPRRERRRSRSRSRSREPERDREYEYRRRRSRERSVEYGREEKRRRVD